MTAINCAVHPDGNMGFMLTDSLVCDLDLNAIGFAAKVITLPHSSVVIACRGLMELTFWASDVIGNFANLDDVRENAEPHLAQGFAEASQHHPGHHVQIVLMGWSPDAKRIRIFTCASDLDFKFIEAPIFIAPEPKIEILAKAGLMVPGRGMDIKSDIPGGLLRIMEIQRHEPMPWGTDPDKLGYAIGGAVVMTVLNCQNDTRTIAQSVIHRWDDRLYEKIVP